MKSDIEIAQEAKMKPIVEVAKLLDIPEDDLELYGKYKAKLSDEYIDSVKNNKNGKLVLVTAINPTPAGEGKTTTTVGLGEALGRRFLLGYIVFVYHMICSDIYSSDKQIILGYPFKKLCNCIYNYF